VSLSGTVLAAGFSTSGVSAADIGVEDCCSVCTLREAGLSVIRRWMMALKSDPSEVSLLFVGTEVTCGVSSATVAIVVDVVVVVVVVAVVIVGLLILLLL